MKMDLTLKGLNLTEEQAVKEILFMRAFDDFLHKKLNKDYEELCNEFCKVVVSKELQSLGATDEEIESAWAKAIEHFADETKKGLN